MVHCGTRSLVFFFTKHEGVLSGGVFMDGTKVCAFMC
jgi:hypothetical protein